MRPHTEPQRWPHEPGGLAWLLRMRHSMGLHPAQHARHTSWKAGFGWQYAHTLARVQRAPANWIGPLCTHPTLNPSVREEAGKGQRHAQARREHGEADAQRD